MQNVISIAMAVYEGEKYLPTQLDSILKQLGADDELVISYDQSKDRSLDIIQEYARKDCRIKVVCNKNPGVTGNFNNALDNCIGDYIYISDQDDKWADNKVAVVQKTFYETGCDLVIHNGIHTNETLEPIGEPFFQMYRIGDGKLKNIAKPRYSGCCMAFTRRMKDIILPIPEIRGYDQWIATVCEFWGRIAYPEEILLYHRLHSSNVTLGIRRPFNIIISMRTKLIICLAFRWLRELIRLKKGSVRSD